MTQRKNERETDGLRIASKMSKMSGVMRKFVAEALMKLWTGKSRSEWKIRSAMVKVITLIFVSKHFNSSKLNPCTNSKVKKLSLLSWLFCFQLLVFFIYRCYSNTCVYKKQLLLVAHMKLSFHQICTRIFSHMYCSNVTFIK